MKKKLKKLMKFLAVTIVCAFMFSACGGGANDTTTINLDTATSKEKENSTTVKSGESEKDIEKKEPTEKYSDELKFYTWAEYFPQSIFDKFEEEYGIKVKLITYESEDAFFENLESGKIKYDLTTLWDLSAKRLYEDNLLAEIDSNNVPNLKYLDDKYKASFDKDLKYTTPISSGFTCLLVNTDIIKEPIKGYKDLWNPKYKNQISLLKEETIGMALKKLGYKPFDSNIENLKEAKAELIKLKPNIAMFNEENGHTYLSRGEIGICQAYSGTSLFETYKNKNIKVVYPEEGIDIWVDNFLMPKDVENKREAELFMNFFYRPEISLEFAQFTMYTTPNKEALKLTNEEEFYATTLPKELLEKATYWEDVTDERSKFDDELVDEFNEWGIRME